MDLDGDKKLDAKEFRHMMKVLSGSVVGRVTSRVN